MRSLITSIVLFLSILNTEASSIGNVYKKYFRGIELHGFSSNEFKLIEVGTELRINNLVLAQSLRYSYDNLYTSYGISSTIQRYFPITKIRMTPFLQYNISSNHSTTKSDLKIQKTILNNISLFAGGGIFIELSKSFQIGSSINYEMNGIFGRPVYFKVRPLIHLKYEFRFI